MRDKYHVKTNSNHFFYPQDWIKMMKLAKKKQRESLMVLINTGARINEARHITLEDFDLERNSLILRITKVRAKKKEYKPMPRHIPVSSQFIKHIKKMAKIYDLYPDSPIPMLKSPALTNAIKKLAKDVGIKEWVDYSNHNVRKTFECWLIALGNDGFKVAKHLGHTPSVALNSYISPDIFTPDDKKLMREVLGDLYGYREHRF